MHWKFLNKLKNETSSLSSTPVTPCFLQLTKMFAIQLLLFTKLYLENNLILISHWQEVIEVWISAYFYQIPHFQEDMIT